MTDEEKKKMERRLRRQAKAIKEEMLADLRARGLVPKEEQKRRTKKARGAGGSEDFGAADDASGFFADDCADDERDDERDGERGSEGGKERKGMGTVYMQMVVDYVELWITRAKLEADIAERGVTVMDNKRGLPVENCSVSARVRVSKQMTTIVQSLGYKDHAVKARRPEVEDDEL